MSQYWRVILLPLTVLGTVLVLITGIGSLLLAVGKGAAVAVALGLALAIMAICTFLATRGYAEQG